MLGNYKTQGREKNGSKQLFNKVTNNKNLKWKQILVKCKTNLARILYPIILFDRKVTISVRITPMFSPILYDLMQSLGHHTFYRTSAWKKENAHFLC